MAASDLPSDPRPRREPPPFPAPPDPDRGPAWELVETGRYRPRRIRGSFPGRELG